MEIAETLDLVDPEVRKMSGTFMPVQNSFYKTLLKKPAWARYVHPYSTGYVIPVIITLVSTCYKPTTDCLKHGILSIDPVS